MGGYRKEHEAKRFKMLERKNFLAKAMRESHGFKASLAAAQKEREDQEEYQRKIHNAIVNRAFHEGKNHRKMEANRIRAIQDRLYNLGKTWMPEKREIIGGVNDNANSKVDSNAYITALKAQEKAENMMKQKKQERIREHRNYLLKQIQQKQNLKRQQRIEEEKFARKCKEGKFLNDQIIQLQQK